ncbi:uncharacterized protein [Ptychodera flava]|uniref:uncharacterized protein n=1 Tax=Ptychodera flava TaxID=63121 RepID=UPI00396A4E9C
MTEIDEEFFMFLRGRGIGERVIRTLQKEKIDSSVIHYMSDDQLAKYIETYGDRVAIFQHYKKGTSGSKRKHTLLSKLRKKLKLRSTNMSAATDESSGDSDVEYTSKSVRQSSADKLIGNKNAKKETRMIEIGWIVKETTRSVQVRTKQGGGTRRVSLNKRAKKSEILEIGQSLFFPHGQSRKGSLTSFDFDVWDFTENVHDDKITIGEMYDETKLPMLRFYIATTRKRSKTSVTESDMTELSQDKSAGVSSSQPTSVEQATGENMVVDDGNTNGDRLHQESTQRPDGNVTQSVVGDLPGSEAASINPEINDSLVLQDHEIPISEDTEVVAVNNSDHIENDERDESDTQRLDFDAMLAMQSMVGDSDSDILFDAITDNIEVDDTIPLAEPTPPTVKARTIRVHRGNVLKELIDAFKDQSLKPGIDIITIEMVLPNGQTEAGEDNGGVTRDCLSEFWSTFYEECTVGATYKVPFLRHDYGKDQWVAVGKIMDFGWKQEKYFPVHLAPPFMEYCLYWDIKSDLTEVYTSYLPESETEIVNQALNNFDSVDEDELLDILDSHQCKTKPTSENIASIIAEIAHKEIIQEPMFVIDCWQQVLTPLKLTHEEFLEMYNNLKPTARKVLKILKYPDNLSPAENEIMNHLHRFIRGLDKNTLGKFLRFCTGANLMVKQEIWVRFVDLAGLARRPVAHTCGCVLELPRSYENFPQFRSEFKSVIDSGIWVMDIV